MSNVVSFDERKQRLSTITKQSRLGDDFGLVQMLRIEAVERERIKTALNIFLWECLSSCYPDRSFPITDDMLRDYTKEVTLLPNITPNGLVLPKCENQLGFNLVQKEAIAAFEKLGIGQHIARVQWPINIRLQSGTPNAEVDSRPRASVKPHSDIWAGDPASGLMSFLTVLGDPDCSGIEFMMPESFPLSFARPLDDYLEGKELADKSTYLCKFDARGWYLVDPFLLHKTTKNKPGFRISIDFRFIANSRVSSDVDEDDSRKPWFLPYSEWAKLGTETLVIAEEQLKQFAPTQAGNRYTVGYPTKIHLQRLRDANDTGLQKAS